MQALIIILLILALPACAHFPGGKIVHVNPRRTITIRFAPDREAVSAQFSTCNWTPDAPLYVKAFCVQGDDLIVIAAPDFNPDVLAHELYHLAGEHWVDKRDIAPPLALPGMRPTIP